MVDFAFTLTYCKHVQHSHRYLDLSALNSIVIAFSCSGIIAIMVLVLHAVNLVILFILVGMPVLSVVMTTSLIRLKSQRFVL